MKTWNSYGSEHSTNLKMIGRFKNADSAEKAKEAIDTITDFMTSGDAEGTRPGQYPEGLMSILEKVGFYSLHPSELEQFTMDIRSELKNDQVVITTDEADVSAFLKLMVDMGARVDVFSTDDHPDANEDDTTIKD